MVPIGQVFADLAEPLKALRPDCPPQRGFTLADQVNQLVSASEEAPDMGFMARLLALCSLPRTNPGKCKEYVRKNGPYTLVMTAGYQQRLPYGNLPRLLLAWVCTEAVRTQSRVLILGRSLSEFMRALGINSTSGGARGEQTRLRNQIQRLFRCSVQLTYQDDQVDSFANSPIASRGEFWWDPKRPAEPMLWASKIYLSEDFFQEIIRRPVPLDMNILKGLKRSTLGLDLYLWLTYRAFTLRAPLRVNWRHLYRQLGANSAKEKDKVAVQAFRRKALRELKKIKLAWPSLNYATAKGTLILLPSKPSISAKQLQLVK